MAAAVLPPSKRQRLGVPEGTPPQANLKKIGKDVFSVFELWKRVHNAALEPIAPSAVTNHLKDLAQGHVAAQCALASVLPRILKKVRLLSLFRRCDRVDSQQQQHEHLFSKGAVQVAVSKVLQLETVSAILGAIHTAPQSVQDTAADAVLPVVRGLLCHESLDSVGADSIKDTFKALALSILVMHSTCEKHADTLISIASAAFECRPYWFIIALTDALEDGDHAALRGAVAFGKRKLLSGGPTNSFFMVSSNLQLGSSRRRCDAPQNLHLCMCGTSELWDCNATCSCRRSCPRTAPLHRKQPCFCAAASMKCGGSLSWPTRYR